MAENKESAKPPAPPQPQPQPQPESAQGVRRQREHIKRLTGQDPLRGGIAD